MLDTLKMHIYSRFHRIVLCHEANRLMNYFSTSMADINKTSTEVCRDIHENAAGGCCYTQEKVMSCNL